MRFVTNITKSFRFANRKTLHTQIKRCTRHSDKLKINKLNHNEPRFIYIGSTFDIRIHIIVIFGDPVAAGASNQEHPPHQIDRWNSEYRRRRPFSTTWDFRCVQTRGFFENPVPFWLLTNPDFEYEM